MRRSSRGARLQTSLYLLTAALEERREREPLSEVGGVLVGGEAGAVGGDLEQYSARLPEVVGAEVEAVYLERNPEPRAPHPLSPCSVRKAA